MLQVLSHTSRAYCAQQKDTALKAFVGDDLALAKGAIVHVLISEPWKHISHSRLDNHKVMATILSFAGDKDFVYGYLQIVNREGRRFCLFHSLIRLVSHSLTHWLVSRSRCDR